MSTSGKEDKAGKGKENEVFSKNRKNSEITDKSHVMDKFDQE